MTWESNLQRSLHRLRFFLTPVHPCSYLSDRNAATLFVDPDAEVNSNLYGQLAKLGFRRSGEHVYRPQCPTCTACKSVRIPVAHFEPSRSQRRTWTKNSDLSVSTMPATMVTEHYELYERYVSQRHPGGGMDMSTPDDYARFMLSDWSNTWMHEFRCGKRLVAVAVTDQFPEGWSAVYTFFEPQEASRGLGVYAILWQIKQLRRLGLPWLYLGYWIAECRKMAYKADFRPLEVHSGDQWRLLEPDGG